MTTNCALTGPFTYDNNVVVMWASSIANVQIPTAAEIALAVDLQPIYNLTDLIGWEISTEIITDGIWGPFGEQRMGGQTIAQSSLVFAGSKDQGADDIRNLLTRGQAGFIIILPSGPYLQHTTSPVNVYPVRVAQITQQQQIRTGGGSLLFVTFAVTSLCGESVFIV
jgi:hypothetical protein